MSLLVNNDNLITVLQLISAELGRASQIHPTYPRDYLRRVALVVEEAGEAMKEALDLTREAPEGYPLSGYRGSRVSLRKELVQTASTAITALLAMEQEDKGEISKLNEHHSDHPGRAIRL